MFFEIGRHLEVTNLRFVVLRKIRFSTSLGFMILLALFQNRTHVRSTGTNLLISANVITAEKFVNCFLFKFKGKWLIIYAAVYFILTLAGNVAHFAGQIGEIF